LSILFSAQVNRQTACKEQSQRRSNFDLKILSSNPCDEMAYPLHVGSGTGHSSLGRHGISLCGSKPGMGGVARVLSMTVFLAL